MLTGSARISQISHEKADKLMRQQEIERKQRKLERKRQAIDAKITELQSNFEIEKQELDTAIAQEKLKDKSFENERELMAKMRHANGDK